MNSKGGPRTEEGKAVVAGPATTHGATSNEVVVADESHSDWCSSMRSSASLYIPSAHLRRNWSRIAHNMWKLRRLRRYELHDDPRSSETVRSRDRQTVPLQRHLRRPEGVGTRPRRDESTEQWLRFVTNVLERADDVHISADDAIDVLETFTSKDLTANNRPVSLPSREPRRRPVDCGQDTGRDRHPRRRCKQTR